MKSVGNARGFSSNRIFAPDLSSSYSTLLFPRSVVLVCVMRANISATDILLPTKSEKKWRNYFQLSYIAMRLFLSRVWFTLIEFSRCWSPCIEQIWAFCIEIVLEAVWSPEETLFMIRRIFFEENSMRVHREWAYLMGVAVMRYHCCCWFVGALHASLGLLCEQFVWAC